MGITFKSCVTEPGLNCFAVYNADTVRYSKEYLE